MSQISVVIITKNEATNIVACIASAKKLSNDIIVIDSGSDDETVSLAKQCGAKVKSVSWSSYGNVRNTGAMQASHDWIFALDADERITDELANEISGIDYNRTDIVYGFKRNNFFNDQQLKFGNLGHEKVFRVYNRLFTQWNNEPVHEKLVTGNGVKKMLGSALLHFGIRDLMHYQQKKMNYAYLCAVKYMNHGKKAPAFFRIVSPAFHFLQSYILRLGFLDGKAGFITAKINANYTWHKYDNLCRMLKVENKKTTLAPSINTSLKRAYSDIV